MTSLSTLTTTILFALALVACSDDGQQSASDSGPAVDAQIGDSSLAADAGASDGSPAADAQAADSSPAADAQAVDGAASGADGAGADGAINASWPNQTNTGIAGVGLTPAQLSPSPTTGKWTITTPNAVFDKFHHKGSIEIKADNVTLKRCYIEHTGGWKVLVVGAKNATIEDCIIVGKSQPSKICVAAISGGNYTARRVDVSGCADGFKLGGQVTIEDSYSHDLFKYGDAATGTHNDSMQLNNGGTATTVTIKGNAFYHYACQSNRHLQAGGVTIGKLTFENNFFYGAHGILNIAGTIGGGQFKNNVLAGSRLSGPFTDGGGNHTGPGLYTGTGVAALTFSGNQFESGESVDTDTRIKGQYTCVP